MNTTTEAILTATQPTAWWGDRAAGIATGISREQHKGVDEYTCEVVPSGYSLRNQPSVVVVVGSASETVMVGTFEHDLWLWALGETVRSEAEPSGNSTVQPERSEESDARVGTLFRAARDQSFEDGMESEFSRELVSAVRMYGAGAIDAIADRIVGGSLNPEIASEALRWLGHMDEPTAYRERLHLLERSLGSPSAWVRDGAALGLALLDDHGAIPYLRQAIRREELEELRRDMEQVLAQLENSRQCHSS